MNTLEMIEDYLNSRNALDRKIPSFFKTLMSTITGNVPEKLKLSIALSEFITLTSQARKPIMLYDGTLVPCNAISFLLASSGFSKDRTKSMIRDTFSEIYDELQNKRRDKAMVVANEIALKKDGNTENWEQHYIEPVEIFSGLGTPEGVLKHFHCLEVEGLASGFIGSSEIGTDLENEGNFKELIKFLSIGYDLGNIPPKIIKDDKNRTPKITGLPINALLFGSQEAILSDKNTKHKFKTMFNTQLARRSIFSYIAEDPLVSDFDNIEDLIYFKDSETSSTAEAKQLIKDKLKDILEMPNNHIALSITKPAKDLFGIYEEYNSHIAETIPVKFNMSKTSRKHKQWLALKLSGNIAIGEKSESILDTHYIQAMNIIEYFSDDLKEFEIELFKEPYELFVAYCKKTAVEKELLVTLHELKKGNFIKTGNVKTVLTEFITILNSYDERAIYTIENENSIYYKELIKSNTCGISSLVVSTVAIKEAIETGSPKSEIAELKGVIAKKIARGYAFNEVTFDKLAKMLQEDYAYSPFKFKDNVRGNNNIISGCKWLVLDVDNSDITIEECHLLLEGINHHLATTSDKNNKFKFRVLIELDIQVEIKSIDWLKFVETISEDIGLNTDKLGQSQIYFSYATQEILSELNGEPYSVKPVLEIIKNKVEKPKIKITTAYSKSMLGNKLGTFEFCFNAELGTRSRNMIRACMYAKDLKAPMEYILQLISEIKEYWQDDFPLEQDVSLQKIIRQVERWNYE